MGNLVALSHPTQKPTRNLSGNSIYSALPVCNRVDHFPDNKNHQHQYIKFLLLHSIFLTKKQTIKMSVSKIRTNFHANSESLINKQINMELHASYVYMSMAAYFDRDDVALQGFAKRFRDNSDEEREHAQKLINYQNMRGGRVVFQNVTKPNTDDWESALSAVEASLELEKKVHESILAMHKNADEHGDAQLTDFLEGEYLKEQVEAQKEIGDLITRMKRAGENLGLHLIDKELQ